MDASKTYLRSSALLAFVIVAVVAACGDDDVPEEPHTACTPPPKPSGGAALATAAPFGETTFTTPVEVIFGPGNRFFVVEQQGVIKVLPPGGGAAPTGVLDISGRITSGGESGLLGLAFDPGFATNGFAYVYYTQDVDKNPAAVFQSIVGRFTSKDGGTTFDATSEKIVLKVDQPFANHNGGHIAFGPDNMLYIGLGDGGSGGDPRGNGQNKDVLLGKMLRIDPNGGDPYSIPATNPFANGGGRPEIYAYGLRNPWKWSFDKLNGDLWAGDVGQGSFEEVDRITLGGNYGWNAREGKHCYNGQTCADPSPGGFIDPITEYGRNEGLSVTGGYVYRGTKIKSLVGKFIYGDFGSGNIWAVDARSSQGMKLMTSGNRISTFGQDAEGEIFVADYVSGKISQLVAADPVAPTPDSPGARLTTTGCINPANPTQAPASAIAYSVASPLWSDGATKDRWVFLPEGSKITVMPDGDFDIPVGSSTVKTFSIDGKKIETRLFVRYPDTTWAGFSYEWNDDQSEALLLSDSKTKPLANGGSWYFPSPSECFACHTQAAGFTLGLEARQLNHDGLLERFAAANALASPIDAAAFPVLRAADSQGATAEERARGYLHANCGICHREGSGTGAATFDLRIDRAFKDTHTCNAPPQAGDLGIVDAKIITPGDPAKSILPLRMRALDQNRMPTLATHIVDEVGTTAVEQWIRETPACP